MPEQQEVQDIVDGMIQQGHASIELTRDWKRHLWQNQLGAETTEVPSSALPDSWAVRARVSAENILSKIKRVRVWEAEESLGKALLAVVFQGPHSSSIVFSPLAKPTEAQQQEREFMLFHAFWHLASPTHLPYNTFGISFEFRRGQTPLNFQKVGADHLEYEADNYATVVQFPIYTQGEELSSLPPQAIRLGMVRTIPPSMRSLLHGNPSLIRHVVMALNNTETKPLPFNPQLQVVKAQEERFVYVLVDDQISRPWKRWVCSPRILACLGLTLKDVPTMRQGRLNEYDDANPLIDPEEVEQFRLAIVRSLTGRDLSGYLHGIPQLKRN